MESHRTEPDRQAPVQEALTVDAILSIMRSISGGSESPDAINALLQTLLINATTSTKQGRNNVLAGNPPSATEQVLQQLTGTCCVSVVDSVADLKALTDTNSIAITRGYHEPSDGGGGIYWKDSGTSPGNNDMSIIDRSDGA